MKVKEKVFYVTLVLLLVTAPIAAQNKTDVKVRFNKQNGLQRIVFEAEETFIQKTKVTASVSRIKLDFPEPFTLTGQKDLPFEMTQADRSLAINVKEKSEIKFFRLSSPARIVLDIGRKEPDALKQPAKETEKKTETPGEKQAERQPASISRTFVIDSGHGGYDFGIRSGNASEKDICLNIAKDLGAALSKKGKKVFLLRKVDQYMPLTERINLVNQKSPDVFISLHISLSKGFVLYGPKFEDQALNDIGALYSLSTKQKRYAGKSKILSDCIEKEIKEEFKADVIRREMPLPLINSVGAPAVFIELPSPGYVVYDQQMRTRLIKAITKGISAYGQ